MVESTLSHEFWAKGVTEGGVCSSLEVGLKWSVRVHFTTQRMSLTDGCQYQLLMLEEGCAQLLYHCFTVTQKC